MTQRRSLFVLVNLGFWLFALTIFAAQEVEKDVEMRKEIVFQQLLSFLPDDGSIARLKTQDSGIVPPKCGMPLFAQARLWYDSYSPEQQAVLDKVLQERPKLPNSMVSGKGNFRIHYTTSGSDAVDPSDRNNNNVPDYVDEVAKAFERSLDIQIKILQYRPLPDDQGIDGQEHDVFIRNLGNGGYGVTWSENVIPETEQKDVTSYIEIDNDFIGSAYQSKGLDGMRVTAAHELLHSIQFGYRDAFFQNEFFYYELCASWVEDFVYDDVNDYYSSAPAFLRDVAEPFNQFGSPAHYGAAIWNHFLEERYDAIQATTRAWEYILEGTFVTQAINDGLRDKSIDFNEAFAEFAIWNYFTGVRAKNSYYKEGAFLGEVPVATVESFDNVVVGAVKSLGCQYYRYTGLADTSYYFTGSSQIDRNLFRFSLIVLRSGNVSTAIVRPGEAYFLGALSPSSQVVVIPVNLQALTGEDNNELMTSTVEFSFKLERGVIAGVDNRGIKAIYPNPFRVNSDGEVQFEYAIDPLKAADIAILASFGKVVHKSKIYFDGQNPTYSWDGNSEAGRPVASGVYLVLLRQGDFMETKKIALIRE